jgi:hypothetical protein
LLLIQARGADSSPDLARWEYLIEREELLPVGRGMLLLVDSDSMKD